MGDEFEVCEGCGSTLDEAYIQEGQDVFCDFSCLEQYQDETEAA